MQYGTTCALPQSWPPTRGASRRSRQEPGAGGGGAERTVAGLLTNTGSAGMQAWVEPRDDRLVAGSKEGRVSASYACWRANNIHATFCGCLPSGAHSCLPTAVGGRLPRKPQEDGQGAHCAGAAALVDCQLCPAAGKPRPGLALHKPVRFWVWRCCSFSSSPRGNELCAQPPFAAAATAGAQAMLPGRHGCCGRSACQALLPWHVQERLMWDGLAAIYDEVGACLASQQRRLTRGLVPAQMWMLGQGMGGPAQQQAFVSCQKPRTLCRFGCSTAAPTGDFGLSPSHSSDPASLPVKGLVEAVGLSNYGPRQLARIKQFLDKRGIPLAAVQVQYSLLRQARAGLPGCEARTAAACALLQSRSTWMCQGRCRLRARMRAVHTRSCGPLSPQPRHRPGGGEGSLR